MFAMSYIDLEFRDFLAKKNPKSIINLNFFSHLKHVNPKANPIKAAIFFKNLWSEKYDLLKINFYFEMKFLTYFEDLDMFSDHFNSKNNFINMGLSVVPTIKNFQGSVKVRDFAEKPLPKYGVDKITVVPEV
jgi:hypothetical protein